MSARSTLIFLFQKSLSAHCDSMRIKIALLFLSCCAAAIAATAPKPSFNDTGPAKLRLSGSPGPCTRAPTENKIGCNTAALTSGCSQRAASAFLSEPGPGRQGGLDDTLREDGSRAQVGSNDSVTVSFPSLHRQLQKQTDGWAAEQQCSLLDLLGAGSEIWTETSDMIFDAKTTLEAYVNDERWVVFLGVTAIGGRIAKISIVTVTIAKCFIVPAQSQSRASMII